jgi:hypothetical protein
LNEKYRSQLSNSWQRMEKRRIIEWKWMLLIWFVDYVGLLLRIRRSWHDQNGASVRSMVTISNCLKNREKSRNDLDRSPGESITANYTIMF